MSEVWVKLEGVLAESPDPPSRWAVGAKLPHAEEVMRFARELVEKENQVVVYAAAADSLRGHRAVQRWLISNDLYAWVAFEQTPPPDVEVIDRWPMSTTNNSDPAASPADRPPTDSLKPPAET